MFSGRFCSGLFLFIRRIWRQFLEVILEEIVVEDAGDAQQQGRVDAFALEDGIHIGALAAQLAGKPCHGAFLAAEFFFYQHPDVYHGGKQKRRNHSLLILILRYRQAPCPWISTNSSRPCKREPSSTYSPDFQIGGFQNRE